MIVMMIYSEKDFSQAELERYSRQMSIPEIGLEGQKKLNSASVLIVGIGGLGSAVALYLAAAGVGKLGLVDFDVVEESNLQRQVMYDESMLGIPKVDAACSRMGLVNSAIKINAYQTRLTAINAKQIAESYSILVDCSDNHPTRYLVNDLAVLTGKPDVYGAASALEGQVSVFDARQGPCYRCLFPNWPHHSLKENGSTGSVLGAIVGVVGTLQAVEVIKLIVGTGEPLTGRLLIYDGLEQSIQMILLKKNPHCAICSASPSITRLNDTSSDPN